MLSQDADLKEEAGKNLNAGEEAGAGKTTGNKYLPRKKGICNTSAKNGGLALRKAVPTFQDGLYHMHYIVVWGLMLDSMLGDPLGLGLPGLDSSWSVGLPTALQTALTANGGKIGAQLAGATLDAGTAMALAVAIGPMIFAMVLLTLYRDNKSFRHPFHKDGIIGSFGFHVLVGTVMVVMPVFHTVKYMYNAPGQSPALML